MKDLFSGHASVYAAFRPTYPDELFRYIFNRIKQKDHAWDCATGNGQVAHVLRSHFTRVEATDISQAQLDQALQAANLHYQCCPAERTPFASATFDLITVAQALHWFDTKAFFSEARRVLKPEGSLAIWGYSLPLVNEEINKYCHRYYNDVVGIYWDDARGHVEDQYNRIHFPFHDMEERTFSLSVEWTANQYIGYIRSWSATQKFIKERGHDPMYPLIEQILVHWKEEDVRTVVFPIFLRLMRP